MQDTAAELDQKCTIANFLATVVAEAEMLGITYDRLYYPTNPLILERLKPTINLP